jgi:seryl-tRNA synthetase
MQSELLESKLSSATQEREQLEQRVATLAAELEGVQWTAHQEHQQLISQSAAIQAQLEQARAAAAEVRQDSCTTFLPLVMPLVVPYSSALQVPTMDLVLKMAVILCVLLFTCTIRLLVLLI